MSTFREIDWNMTVTKNPATSDLHVKLEFPNYPEEWKIENYEAGNIRTAYRLEISKLLSGYPEIYMPASKNKGQTNPSTIKSFPTSTRNLDPDTWKEVYENIKEAMNKWAKYMNKKIPLTD